MEHEMDMHKMMMDMNKKMDIMMEHLGCKKLSEKDYLSMSEDDKDEYDEKEIKSKVKEEAEE